MIQMLWRFRLHFPFQSQGLPVSRGAQIFTLSRRGGGGGLGLPVDEILVFGLGRWSGLPSVSLLLPAFSFGDLPFVIAQEMDKASSNQQYPCSLTAGNGILQFTAGWSFELSIWDVTHLEGAHCTCSEALCLIPYV